SHGNRPGGTDAVQLPAADWQLLQVPITGARLQRTSLIRAAGAGVGLGESALVVAAEDGKPGRWVERPGLRPSRARPVLLPWPEGPGDQRLTEPGRRRALAQAQAWRDGTGPSRRARRRARHA